MSAGAMRISYIIPCYNAGVFLSEAVASLRQQEGDFHIYEILIVNDRSDDLLTRRILGELSREAGITVLDNQGARGAAGARNSGMRCAKSEWLGFLDADDVLMEGALQNVVLGQRRFPDATWVGADYVVWHEDGTMEEKGFFATHHWPRVFLHEAFEEGLPVRVRRPVEAFVRACMAKISTCIFRADTIREEGGFSEKLRQAEDHQLFIRLALSNDYIFVPNIVLKYRRHDKNMTKEEVPPGLWPREALLQLRDQSEFARHRKVFDQQIAYNFVLDSYYHRTRAEWRAAANAAARALSYSAVQPGAWFCLAASLAGR